MTAFAAIAPNNRNQLESRLPRKMLPEKLSPIDTSTWLMDVTLTGGRPFPLQSTLTEGDRRLKRTIANAMPLANGLVPSRLICR